MTQGPTAPMADQRLFSERGVPPTPGLSSTTSRVRLLADRAASIFVTGAGISIIASILGIFAFILIEVSPLLRPARVNARGRVPVPGGPVLALLGDEHRTHAAALDADGHLRVVRLAGGSQVLDRALLSEQGPAAGRTEGSGEDHSGSVRLTGALSVPGRRLLAAATSDGRVLIVPVTWRVTFAEDLRSVEPEIGETVSFDMDAARRPIRVFAVQADPGGSSTAVAQIEGGSLVVVARSISENAITGEKTTSEARHAVDVPAPLSAMVMDGERQTLYGGTSAGEIFEWRISDGVPSEPRRTSAGTSGVTALGLLIGDRSLVVGQADGSLGVWFPVRQPDDLFALTRIHEFPPLEGGVRLVEPSTRGKGFLAAGGGGKLGLYYSTSERVLWSGSVPVERPAAINYLPKADGALVAGVGGIASIAIDNPHPEVSWKALFGRIWYEGYPEPAHVWQSSGGTDDFEPKLSLIPLLVGTLKGTFYSLILAVPLAVLSAMYTSQFMHPNLKGIVKPTVEIMAALPSVVLGFLAGLWLAPRVERIFPALLLMALVLPAAVLLSGLAWRTGPRRITGFLPAGSEVAVYILALAAGAWICLRASGPIETHVFGGSFPQWLSQTFSLPYDQRNAVVVGLAMGFAVIPIIFAIAEDAFSNVPANLPAGSLALGATRWQTVTRLVLPTASPGIFSAIMVGFGRAVGETMIVVMATGNTPILDWNPFNGFRTLSANIAVEIPEAPHGGTLYRTLFLAALLLFLLTFSVNTAAELIRQRLRRRYAEL